MFIFLHLDFGKLGRTEVNLPGSLNLSVKQEPWRSYTSTTASHVPLERLNFVHREGFGVGGESIPSCHSVMSAIPHFSPLPSQCD